MWWLTVALATTHGTWTSGRASPYSKSTGGAVDSLPAAPRAVGGLVRDSREFSRSASRAAGLGREAPGPRPTPTERRRADPLVSLLTLGLSACVAHHAGRQEWRRRRPGAQTTGATGGCSAVADAGRYGRVYGDGRVDGGKYLEGALQSAVIYFSVVYILTAYDRTPSGAEP